MAGCKSLNTQVEIESRALPDTFDTTTVETNIAHLSWREFFNDSLLVQLIDTAIENNLDLLQALQRIEMSRFQVQHATGALLPQLGLGTSAAIRRFGLYTMDGAGNSSTEMLPGQIVPTDLPDFYLGTYATWEVDIWGKLRNKRKAALSDYLATVEGVNFVISNLVADVATAYYELIALDAEIEVIKQTKLKQKIALEAVELQKEAGKTNALAVEQFTALLFYTEALEKEIVQKIIETENQINLLLGRFPQTIKRNSNGLNQSWSMNLDEGIPSQLLENRPDIRQAELQVKASKYDLQSAKAAFYPNINISASAGYQSFSTALMFSTPQSLAYTALAGMAAPILNQKQLRAQFNTAKAAQINALYEYQNAILNGFIEVANEVSNIENLNAVNEFTTSQNNAMLSAVDISQELFYSGRANYIEVLIAQQNALQSQIDLIIVRKRLKQSGVMLFKVLGGGWR